MTLPLKNIGITVGIILGILLIAGWISQQTRVSVGSVTPGGGYIGTTTQSTAGLTQTENSILTTGGMLGSVVITGVTTGTISIYDATTSDITKRTGGLASSSILLAAFPASATAGTYTFDRNFYTGLYVSITGIVPTTTITYRTQ